MTIQCTLFFKHLALDSLATGFGRSVCENPVFLSVPHNYGFVDILGDPLLHFLCDSLSIFHFIEKNKKRFTIARGRIVKFL